MACIEQLPLKCVCVCQWPEVKQAIKQKGGPPLLVRVDDHGKRGKRAHLYTIPSKKDESFQASSSILMMPRQYIGSYGPSHHC